MMSAVVYTRVSDSLKQAPKRTSNASQAHQAASVEVRRLVTAGDRNLDLDAFHGEGPAREFSRSFLWLVVCALVRVDAAGDAREGNRLVEQARRRQSLPLLGPQERSLALAAAHPEAIARPLVFVEQPVPLPRAARDARLRSHARVIGVPKRPLQG
jgi:hypothetical protein